MRETTPAEIAELTDLVAAWNACAAPSHRAEFEVFTRMMDSGDSGHHHFAMVLTMIWHAGWQADAKLELEAGWVRPRSALVTGLHASQAVRLDAPRQSQRER